MNRARLSSGVAPIRTCRTSLGKRLGFVLTAFVVGLASVLAAPTMSGTSIGQDVPSGRGVDSIQSYLATLPPGYQDKQIALMDFNGKLAAVVRDSDGYVGSVDDVESGSTTIYWYARSPIPPSVRSLISSAEVHVTMASWPFSRAQIETASKRLISASKAGKIPGFQVDAVAGFDGEFQGLRLEGTYTSEATPAVTSKASSAARIIASMPVSLKQISSGPADGSRDWDTPPFYAGGMMYSPSTNGICSSGFAISFFSGTHITTARHCRENDFLAPDNGSSQYGATYAWDDQGMARLMTASGGGRAFDGPWDSVAFTKAVVGTVPALGVGDSVCTDGANSGVHCGVQIDNLYVYWDDGYGTERLIKASVGSGIAVIQGDSGGPVLVPLSNGTDIYAAGMIQRYYGNDLNPNCGSTFSTGTNVCTRGVGFTPIAAILDDLPGASLVLG